MSGVSLECLRLQSGFSQGLLTFLGVFSKAGSHWSGHHLCWFASFTSKDNYQGGTQLEKKTSHSGQDPDKGRVNKQTIRLRTEGSTDIKLGPLLWDWLLAGAGIQWFSAGWYCPQGHGLEIWEDVARMGGDVSGIEWVEAGMPGDMSGDL